MQFTNTVSEEYLASAIINDPEKNIPHLRSEGFDTDYFHNYLPRFVWNRAVTMFDAGKIHGIETLELSNEVLASANGREFSSEISRVRTQFYGNSSLSEHVDNIKQAKSMRIAHQIVTSALEDLSEYKDAMEVMERIRIDSRAIYGVMQNNNDWKTAEQSAEEFAEMLRSIHLDKTERGTPSGIECLDKITGGLHKNELWVIAAPTSGGKTVLMFQIAANFLTQNKKVLIFSLETDADMIHSRIAANLQTIHMSNLLGTNGSKLSNVEMHKIKDYINDIKERGLVNICDKDNLTLENITAISDQVAESGESFDLIVVDYIQLVTLKNVGNKARHEQVAEVTRTMKQMAKRFQCPVLTASQLNDDGRVRESRAITHDADVFLKIEDDAQSVFVGKNRNGERGSTLPLVMVGAYQRFDEHS